MVPEELRVRSLYIFLSCSRAIEEASGRVRAAVPDSLSSVQPALDKTLKKELALLFRYWATRRIWERLGSDELGAKELNLALLRLFFEGFKLPKDGSGMRYAELSTVSEEIRELAHRVAHALGGEHPPLLEELERAILPWRDAVLQCTAEALSRSTEDLSSAIAAWGSGG